MSMAFARSATLRGFLGATLLVLVSSFGLLPLISSASVEPSAELLRALGQIGATLLIAYAVEVSWLLKVSRARSERRATWVGYVSAIGTFGLIGIALALALSEHGASSYSLIAQFALCVALFSLLLLGALVALLPLLVYEWAHASRTEYPDE